MKQPNVDFLSGELPRVIVITGDDFIGREKAKEKILLRLHEQYQDLSEEHFDQSIESFTLYAERIITPSLFQNVRLFSIRHAQSLSEPDLQTLSSVMSVDCPDVYVIIESEGKKEKKGITEKLSLSEKVKMESTRYRLLQFDRPPDYKMAEWLTTQVPLLFGRNISRDAADRLIDLAGTELDKLYAELQKLDIHLTEKAAIDKTAVERVCGAYRNVSPFELAEALGRKDFARTLQIIDSLYQDGFYAPLCISAIFRHFWKILRIRVFAREHKEVIAQYRRSRYTEQTKVAFEIGVATGALKSADSEKRAYPVMILSGIIEQADTFTFEQLKQIFLWLRDFDVGVKTGTVKPTREHFQLLCYSIIRVAEILGKDSAR